MAKELFLLSEKVKLLRERVGLTQSDLARSLGLTRSSVNAWEMGLSVPSTQYIVELAKAFNVSTDYLLGMESTATISVESSSLYESRQLFYHIGDPIASGLKSLQNGCGHSRIGESDITHRRGDNSWNNPKTS